MKISKEIRITILFQDQLLKKSEKNMLNKKYVKSDNIFGDKKKWFEKNN